MVTDPELWEVLQLGLTLVSLQDPPPHPYPQPPTHIQVLGLVSSVGLQPWGACGEPSVSFLRPLHWCHRLLLCLLQHKHTLQCHTSQCHTIQCHTLLQCIGVKVSSHVCCNTNTPHKVTPHNITPCSTAWMSPPSALPVATQTHLTKPHLAPLHGSYHLLPCLSQHKHTLLSHMLLHCMDVTTFCLHVATQTHLTKSNLAPLHGCHHLLPCQVQYFTTPDYDVTLDGECMAPSLM